MNAHSLLRSVETCLRQQLSTLSPPLAPLCRYAMAGGRRTRALLLLHAAERDDQQAVLAACAVEMLHAATLLQDDIFDASVQRRGRAAAHVQFGKAQSTLASDWLLVRALELAAETHPAFFRQLSRAALTMAQTAAQELQPCALHSFAAAEAHMDQVARGKTAVLFSAAFAVAAHLRHRSADDVTRWAQVGVMVGCTYQALDDCLDVYATADQADKDTGRDLGTGRLTRPLLLAFDVLRGKGRDPALKRFIDGQLSPAEIHAVRQALQTCEVRQAARRQVCDALQQLRVEASHAGVPESAVALCAADLCQKLQTCFGPAASEPARPPAAPHGLRAEPAIHL